MDLAARVLAFCREQALVGTTGVIAVSGGPDSVALADVLVGLLRQGELAGVVFAHFNHLLRGADSDADEAFVSAMATAAGVPVHSTRVDIARAAAEAGANLEDTARRQRYDWLAQVARTARSTWIATGHTADDQAETVLFRLLRGSGLQGLGGMAPRRPLQASVELVRPLLGVRRREVMEYLQQRGIAHRDDASNRDLHFTRNRLRHELIPQLQEHYNPAVVDVLCRLATQAQAVQSDIAARAVQLLQRAELPRAGAILVLRAEVLAAAPVHLAAEAFRLLWRREGWPLDGMGFDDWQRLVGIAAGQRTAWEFPGRIRVRRTGTVVQIEASQER